MADNIVDVRNLSRRFGQTLALDGVTFTVPRGCVFGLVGENGAGKTTLMKHLLGLLKAESGYVRVFGLDPVREPAAVLSRIGYLSEDRDLPEWMRIDQLLVYTRAFHPTWNQDYADELVRSFGLELSKKVKNLSKGMRAQAGLIAAAAPQPDLLLLDEPSTGLDAVVRRDILNALVRAVAEDGRTAVFSSHLLDEVERMSDYVGMVHQGRLIFQGSVDDVREQHHLLNVRFFAPLDRPPQIDDVLTAEGREHHWNLICTGTAEEAKARIVASGAEILSGRTASLEEIFVARAGRRRTEVNAE